MPWKVNKKGDKYFVENEMTGRIVGNHKTEAEAKKQLDTMVADHKMKTKDIKVNVHIARDPYEAE